MANEKKVETLDDVLTDVPAEKQTQENGVNQYVTKAFEKSIATIQEARQKGTAVWQNADKESLKKIHYPEIVGRNKDGNDIHYFPASINVLGALQEQAKRNTFDFRWMRAEEALKAKDISITPGAKAVDFVFYTKVSQEERAAGKKPKAYVKKMFNVSDLYGKGVPSAIDFNHDHTKDMFARDMVFYMSRREANNTLSFDSVKDYMKMFSGAINFAQESQVNRADWAKAQADARAEAQTESQAKVDEKAEQKVESPERKAMKEEQAKRLDAILAADATKAKTTAEKFVCFLKEGYEQNPKTFVTFAVEKAMKELNFTEKNAKTAITKFAPGAAFDGGKKAPYADRVMDMIAKNNQKEKGAAR